MPGHRTTGLTGSQLRGLVRRVEAELPEPWNKPVGRPRATKLGRAVYITCAYLRQNMVQEVLAEFCDVSQPSVSRVISDLLPIVEAVLEEFVPTEDDAAATIRGTTCLVDGTLTPCWSYKDHRELWNKKHRTTGFNVQILSLANGTAVYVSEPLPGNTHDINAFRTTYTEIIASYASAGFGDKGYQGAELLITPRKKPRKGELSENDKETNKVINKVRAPVERTVAHIKDWKILHTDYRRPYETFHDTFRAVRALFFYSQQGFE